MTRVGRSLGGYQIEDEIGRGGIATVYRAFQPQLERWVAIKALAIGDKEDEISLTVFRREARAIAALRHPNILTIYDYGEEAKTAYIVMEYIAGGTLEQLLDGTPREWSEVVNIIIPVARALAHAHKKGIVHCDVKPSNVLMQRDDWPLLADFGLLRLRGTEDVAYKPGLMSGTPSYASPEQIAGGHVGQRSDIYSLGIVLYELVTGRLPFEDAEANSPMLLRLLEQPTRPSVHKPDVEADLERILMRMLARDPAGRYSDMESVINDLVAVPGTSVPPESHSLSLNARHTETKTLNERPATSGPHLIVTGTATVLTLPRQREVVLGRAIPRASGRPDVDLGPYGGIEAGVSRSHARLRYTAEGWLLEDLNSTNGTTLNMAPIPAGELFRVQSGDVIRCGRLMLIFFDE